MSGSWFFATTPIPQRPRVGDARPRTTLRSARRWWQRLVERYLAWGVRSERRLPPWLYY